MTVGELREMLIDVPDDLGVFILELAPLGGFLFKPACVEESGVTDFGEVDEASGEFGATESGFIISPHGMTEEEDDGIDISIFN